MKKLILWDLDGTLIDTLEDLAEAVNYALKLRGLPLHTVDAYRKMVGHGVRNLVQQALEASLREQPGHAGEDGGPNRVPPAEVDTALAGFKAYYQAHIDVHTRPYPGMPELLTELQAKGVKMGVASNKFQEGTEHLIKEFFPDIPFVAILGNRPGYPLKPDPKIVEEVLSQGGIGPEDAVMVGDSPTDMRTAANGGIEAIAVSWGYRTQEELAGNRMVNSVEELRKQLLGFYVSDPLSTPPTPFKTKLQQLVYKTFAAKQIPFTRVDTDPGITMEDCQHIDAKIGIHIVKTIFLCNRQQTEFYLYVTSDDKPFVTRDFCGALGIPRVSFASADKLWDLTGVRVGATTILSAILPEAANVHLVMDKRLADAEWFACTDGTPTCFVKIRTQDLLDKYLEGKTLTLIG